MCWGGSQNYLMSFWMFSIASATSFPFLVSFISFIRPFFSKLTRLNISSVCKIFTAWLYVQSTSLANTLPYLILVFLFKETSIKAGFLLKKISKLSFIVVFFVFLTRVFYCIYSDSGLLLNVLKPIFLIIHIKQAFLNLYFY